MTFRQQAMQADGAIHDRAMGWVRHLAMLRSYAFGHVFMPVEGRE